MEKLIIIKQPSILNNLNIMTKAGICSLQEFNTFRDIRKLFNWAVGRDLVESSPCNKIPKPSKENQSDRVLSEHEILTVWDAFESQEPLTGAIFKIMLLTAQRPGEVVEMNWNKIENGWWTIMDPKNEYSHRVALSKEVLKILEEIKPLGNGSQWVFPGINVDKHRVAIHKAHNRISKYSKVKFVPHDLRRTAASHMTSMGISRLVVSKILNHAERGVTAVYDRHSYDQEKRIALNAWGNQLNKILNKEASWNIVNLKAV